MTFSPNKENQDIFTVRKKSGEQRTFTGGPVKPMTHEELQAKYYRLAEFMEVDKSQADRAIQQWMNLKAVKDIGRRHSNGCEVRSAATAFGQEPGANFLMPDRTRSRPR